MFNEGQRKKTFNCRKSVIYSHLQLRVIQGKNRILDIAVTYFRSCEPIFFFHKSFQGIVGLFMQYIPKT